MEEVGVVGVHPGTSVPGSTGVPLFPCGIGGDGQVLWMALPRRWQVAECCRGGCGVQYLPLRTDRGPQRQLTRADKCGDMLHVTDISQNAWDDVGQSLFPVGLIADPRAQQPRNVSSDQPFIKSGGSEGGKGTGAGRCDSH